MFVGEPCAPKIAYGEYTATCGIFSDQLTGKLHVLGAATQSHHILSPRSGRWLDKNEVEQERNETDRDNTQGWIRKLYTLLWRSLTNTHEESAKLDVKHKLCPLNANQFLMLDMDTLCFATVTLTEAASPGLNII